MKQARSVLSNPISWGLLALFFFSIIGLGYFTTQSQFQRIAPFYGLGFLAYLFLLSHEWSLKRWPFWLGVGIILRFILLFGMPTLSDDVYRFIWDGRLIMNGINPFTALPSTYLELEEPLAGINQELFNLLNSPAYFTIYPPLAQGSFALSTYLFFDSIYGATLVLKGFIFLCEMGSLCLIVKLLKQFERPTWNVLIYALNPLIIVETVGNLHYEAAMVVFLLWAIYLLKKQQLIASATLFSLSITSKLLSILFLPYLWSRLGWRKSILYYIATLSLTSLLFSPLINLDFINGFSNSIDLYFRKFEFNGSIYYLIRWIGYQVRGFNIIQTIGPKLGLLAVGIIGLSGLLDPKKDWSSIFSRMLFAICIYLSLATTVHPWYTILPLVLCSFTNWRFPIIWTALIWITYINYSYQPYWENIWLVALEYLVVILFFAYEVYQKKRLGEKWIMAFAKNY